MTSRKTAADNEGWKRGARSADVSKGNKFGENKNQFKLNRVESGSDPWERPVVLTDDYTDIGPKSAHTSNSDNELTRKVITPERNTNSGARDIYNNVVKNSLDDDAGGSRPGPIKYGVD